MISGNERVTLCPGCGELAAVEYGKIAHHLFPVDARWENAHHGMLPPRCPGFHHKVAADAATFSWGRRGDCSLPRYLRYIARPLGLWLTTRGEADVLAGTSPPRSSLDKMYVLCPGCGWVMPIYEMQIAKHSAKYDATSGPSSTPYPLCPDSGDIVIDGFHDMRAFRHWALQGLPEGDFYTASGKLRRVT